MKTSRLILTSVFVLLSNALVTAAPKVLWSIGTKDKSGKDLGLERNHENFAKQIKPGFTYDVKSDQPTKWPYIHPGPVDKWAGNTSHPLTISFELPSIPKGSAALVINTTGAYVTTERMNATINGQPATVQIPSGPGDPSLYDEQHAKPESTRVEFLPDLLRAGKNEITLAVIDGAWILYDNVQLEIDESAKPTRLANFHIDSTPCFTTGTQGGLAQVIRVNVSNRGGAQAFTASTASGKIAPIAGTSNQLQFGDNPIQLAVPEVQKPTSVTITLESGGEKLSGTASVYPHRKWKIFATPSIHTDIGYTHRQDEVFHRHNVNLDKVKEMCRENPLFRWSIEVAWEVQNYFSDRTPAQQKELMDLAHQGRLGVNAGYLNLLTSLMSDEAMNHYAYYSAGLRRRYGIRTETTLMTDIPSATRGLAVAMAGSGIRYFAEGCNQDRGPTINNGDTKAPFYWELPDGSRVLSWLSNMYAQSAWLAHATSVDAMYDHVNGIIGGYERLGDQYPFDAIYQYGAFLDNWEVDKRYGQYVKDWNARYAYPQIIVCAGPEWFEYLEQNYAEKIPVRKQDFGAYWEDGAGSTQQETTIHMGNQQRVTTAETLFSLARLAGSQTAYPLDRFMRVWDDILLYAEHTWGAAQSISAPEDPSTIDQWKFKADYAHRPDKQTKELQQEALAAYLKTVSASKGDLVVFNPNSWPRSGLVDDDEGALWVQDVPALGSKVVKADSAPTKASTKENDGILENKFYRVQLSADKGITSIRDKETNAELIKSDAEYGFAQVVYASGGDGTRMIHPDQGPFAKFETNTADDRALNAPQGGVLVTNAKIKSIGAEREIASVYQEAVIKSSAPAMPEVTTRIRLFENDKRISVDVDITSKTEIRKKEAVYIAFPFTGSQPQFRLGMTNLVQSPHTDFAKGACHEWYCIQDFVSMADEKAGTEIVWSSPDAPLVCLSEINRGRWIAEPELTTSTIFSYVMNNYWHTNYKAGQGGDFHFRYDLTSGKPGFSNEACIRFARDTARPLIATAAAGSAASAASAASANMEPAIAVEGKGVIVNTIAGGQDGKGTIVRLRNTENTDTVAKLKAGSKKASLVNIVEDPMPSNLANTDGVYSINLKAQQTLTVRLE